MRLLTSLLLLFITLTPASAETRFLSIADIHYGEDNPAGDGHDTGRPLLTLALNKFSQLSKDVNFIVTLGDFPTHIFPFSAKKNDYTKTVFHELYQADNHKKPMFYISGNNDPTHGNYQPFSWKGESVLSLANDWNGACAHCEGLIIDDTHMESDGYYSSYVQQGKKDIILIALNTTQFARIPFFLPNYPNQEKDALAQLQWLEQQLNKHHAKQLLIAMHIPPGYDYKGKLSWQKPYLNQFVHLLEHTEKQYGQISLLTAHTHMDDLRKIHLQDGKVIYAYATPSISQLHHNNPAMKIFTLGNNDQMKNYSTYFTTLAGEWGNEHYSAVRDVFAQCGGKTLTQCLDGFSDLAMCRKLNDSLGI